METLGHGPLDPTKSGPEPRTSKRDENENADKLSSGVKLCAFAGHNHLGPFLRAAALRQQYSTSTEQSVSSREDRRMRKLSAEWAWPEDTANPLSRLSLLASLDLSSNALTHLGCDVLASLRSLSELVVADNLVGSLDDVSLQCAGLRLARLDVSRNRLTQLIVQSLSGLSGLQELDAHANPLQCDGDAACVTRREFRRWLNDTIHRLTLIRHDTICHDTIRHDTIRRLSLVRHNTIRHDTICHDTIRHDAIHRLTLIRHADEVVDEYICHDSGVSYISGPLDCDEPSLTVTAEQLAGHQGSSRQYTGVILVSISAVTVLIVAACILSVGLLVGCRSWRRSDVDYCKRRQSQLLQHDHHHHDVHQVDAGEPSSRLQTFLTTWLRRCWPSHASMSSVVIKSCLNVI